VAGCGEDLVTGGRRAAATLALAAIAGSIAASGARAAPPADIDPAVRGALTRYLKFSAGDLSEVQRGRVVKHGLDAKAPGEFGVAGAVRVAASKAAFLAAARDIVTFKSGPAVVQIGRFGSPPAIEDLMALAVDRDDFDPMACRVGSCDVRLPADAIRRLPHEIDLTGPALRAQAAAWFKQALLADVAAYVSGGPGRFAQYDDGDRPIEPLDDFAGVLAATPAIDALVPGLAAHLARFPDARVPDAEDFLYWSKETFGSAPFISVTHVTIVCASARTCVMTTKDVYSSRYIDASLALAIVTDADATGGTIDVIYANRSRVNALKGVLSGLRRTLVERRARATLEQSLVAIKTRLERRR
jgi:hypothetical protein